MKRRIFSHTEYVEYNYHGPAYRFGKYVGEFDVTTSAPTIGRAKTNVLGRIKKELGYDYKAKLEIDERCLTLVDKSDLDIDSVENDLEESSPEWKQLSLFGDD